MNKQDDKQNLGLIRLDFLRFIGAVAGGTMIYLITSNLSSLSSALACAIAIATLCLTSTRFSHPILWWASLGASAGGIAGTGSVLADSINHSERQANPPST